MSIPIEAFARPEKVEPAPLVVPAPTIPQRQLEWDKVAQQRTFPPGPKRLWRAALAIHTAYDRLSMTRPEGTRADTARRRARHLGWPPPLAWDDIDDPDETPTGHHRDLRKRSAFHLDDIAEHLTHNPATTTAQLAHRFGVQPNAIQQRLVRAGRTDLLDHLARNATLAGHGNGRRKGQAA